MYEVWTCDGEYDLKNDNFSKIFRFFVIETPISDDSVRSISLEKRNLKVKSIIHKLKTFSKELENNWHPISEKDNYNNSDIIEIFSNNGIINHTDNFIEIAVFKVPKNWKIWYSFIHVIRCSLAHGAFCIHNNNGCNYYFFENIYYLDGDVEINSRIVLKEETIISFIDYCDSYLKKNK